MNRTHTTLLVCALLGLGCSPKSRSQSGKPSIAPPAPSLLGQLERAKAKSGELLIVATKRGIEALTSGLESVALLSKDKGRYLHLHRRSGGASLYYLVYETRQLKRLDLATGKAQIVATLPLIKNACFNEANPIAAIQDEDHFSVDPDKGTACIRAQDRNTNMMSTAINYRIDLKSGEVKERLTFDASRCAKGATVDAKALCMPSGIRPGFDDAFKRPVPGGGDGMLTAYSSPSKRWVFIKDLDLGEEGDYIHGATLLYDSQRKTTYALEETRLRAVDYSRLLEDKKRPEKMCLITGEARHQWLKKRDVLLMQGCADGLMVIEPPHRVRTLDATHFAIY